MQVGTFRVPGDALFFLVSWLATTRRYSARLSTELDGPMEFGKGNPPALCLAFAVGESLGLSGHRVLNAYSLGGHTLLLVCGG